MCNFRVNCSIHAIIAPSHPQEPITITPSPEWSFQQIVIDIFLIGHVAYLTCADKLTGWLILYHLKLGHTITSKLMSICQQLFYAYGTPDELSTNNVSTFHLQFFSGIPSDVVCEAQTVLSRIPPIQWPGRACSKNCKEDSEWEYNPLRFFGQWQCWPGHPVILKHPNPRYCPITSTTISPSLTPKWVVVVIY